MKNLKEIQYTIEKAFYSDDEDDYGFEVKLTKETIDFYNKEITLSTKNNSIYLEVAKTDKVLTQLKIADHATTLKDLEIFGVKQEVIGYKYLNSEDLKTLNCELLAIQSGDFESYVNDEITDWDDEDDFKEAAAKIINKINWIIDDVNEAKVEKVELKTWAELRGIED